MKNALIWFTVFLLIIFIAHKTPKQAQEWLIIELGAALFWLGSGALLIFRACYRFMVRP